MRNFLILLVCGALIFAAVWKVAPGVLAIAMPYPEAKTIEENPPAPKVAAKPALPKTATRSVVPQSFEARVEPAAAAPSAQPVLTNDIRTDRIPALTPEVLADLGNRSGKFRVAAEGLTLYSTNSPMGRVVKVLKSGDILELQFRLNYAGQEWMFVNMPDRKVSGFLPLENGLQLE
jgi:hypothetical protein